MNETISESTNGGEVQRPWAAVLFDLDGTLADTVPLILRSYRHTMKTHLGRELPDSEWLRTIGTPVREQLRAFARDEEEILAMAETYAAFQRVHHDGMVSAFPGARAVAEALSASGAGLGVVTSKRREMAKRTMDRCGLADLFPVLVCADDVVRAKPDPEPVRLALSQMGLEERPAEVLFVGDSPFDVVSGRGAGVRTAGALWGAFERPPLERAGAHYMVATLEEVLLLNPFSG